jgi:hypothetical protein
VDVARGHRWHGCGGGAVTALETHLARGAAARRGTACAGVCMRVRLLMPERRVGVAMGRRGGVHGEARLDAMGGGERGARGWSTRTRQGARRGV